MEKKPIVAVITRNPQASRLVAEMQAHGLISEGSIVPATMAPSAYGQGAGTPMPIETVVDFLRGGSPLSVQ